MSKRGLGRGLDALIESTGGFDGKQVLEIALSDIEPNPDQPRKEFAEDELQELAASLRLHGLLQPILVRKVQGRYLIVAGERRFRAAALAGFERMACLVQEGNELQMAERALVENIQRADLSPVEEGRAYARLMKEYGLTQDEVSKKVGKGRATVANLLRIVQLPGPVLELLQNAELSLGHAKVLAGLEDSSLQVLVGRKAAASGLSVRETEELLDRLQGRSMGQSHRQKKGMSPTLDNLQERLSSSFQTKVRLKGSEQRGKIEIEYFSEEELNRLLELWQVVVE